LNKTYNPTSMTLPPIGNIQASSEETISTVGSSSSSEELSSSFDSFTFFGFKGAEMGCCDKSQKWT